MKTVAFSDLHVHPFSFGGSIDPATNRHNRVEHGLEVLRQTAAAAVDVGAKIRFFAGDLFHERGKLKPSVLNPVVDHFREKAGKVSFLDIFMPGNHDEEARSDGEHALDVLRGIEGVKVLDGHGYEVISLDDGALGIGWVCHTPNVADLKDRVQQVAAQARLSAVPMQRKVFMVHHGVDGALDGVPFSGFGPADLPTDDFGLVLCGDYHNHKELVPKKAWMIGAPIQHNFGDAGQPRGFMVIDHDINDYELRPVHGVPLFKTITIKDGVLPAVDWPSMAGNFVRVRSDDEKALDAHEAQAIAAGALAVQREFVKDWKAIDRADVTLTMTTGQMFNTWLDDQDVGLLDKDEIKALNTEILREAGVA